MNKLYITLLFTFLFTTTQAQITHSIQHYSNGLKDTFLIADIDSITYFTSTVVTCPSSLTDSRDGEVYPVVQIGNQCWMAENLRYNASGSWVNPSNPSTNYGRLYDWSTAMDGASSSSSNPSGVQGVCPNGWHLPSDTEFTTLTSTIGSSGVGTAMKSTTGWSNNNGTNSSGFNGFPSGRIYQNVYYDLGDFAQYWSATQSSSTKSWYLSLNSASSGTVRHQNLKVSGYSCRCVKD